MKPVHTVPSDVFKINFNIILPVPPRSSRVLIPSGFPTKTVYAQVYHCSRNTEIAAGIILTIRVSKYVLKPRDTWLTSKINKTRWGLKKCFFSDYLDAEIWNFMLCELRYSARNSVQKQSKLVLLSDKKHWRRLVSWREALRILILGSTWCLNVTHTLFVEGIRYSFASVCWTGSVLQYQG